MYRYRESLPQMSKQIFLSDGGLETTMIYHYQLELPRFAAITLMENETKQQIVWDYFVDYLGIAQQFSTGFILESVTWRGNPAWAKPLGYTEHQFEKFNRRSVRMLHALRGKYETASNPIVISGCLGPYGDAYDATQTLAATEAMHYHAEQIRIFREEQADLVTAMTLMNAAEAIGITRAAQSENMPVVISFTVETDGLLPDGQALHEAIEEVDTATGQGPEYYMINCAHPTHFLEFLRERTVCQKRIRGIRANASCKSHAELDDSDVLDAGDPLELAERYAQMLTLLPNITVLGGCCGTDLRHIKAIAEACCLRPPYKQCS